MNFDKRIFTSFIFLLFVSSNADASNWFQLVKGNGGVSSTDVYIDVSSIVHKKAIVKVWVKLVYPSLQCLNSAYTEVDCPIGQSYINSTDYWEIDCHEHTVGVVSTVAYDLNSKVVFSNAIPQPSTPIVPDSYGDDVATFVCAKKH